MIFFEYLARLSNVGSSDEKLYTYLITNLSDIIGECEHLSNFLEIFPKSYPSFDIHSHVKATYSFFFDSEEKL